MKYQLVFTGNSYTKYRVRTKSGQVIGFVHDFHHKGSGRVSYEFIDRAGNVFHFNADFVEVKAFFLTNKRRLKRLAKSGPHTVL